MLDSLLSSQTIIERLAQPLPVSLHSHFALRGLLAAKQGKTVVPTTERPGPPEDDGQVTSEHAGLGMSSQMAALRGAESLLQPLFRHPDLCVTSRTTGLFL